MQCTLFLYRYISIRFDFLKIDKFRYCWFLAVPILLLNFNYRLRTDASLGTSESVRNTVIYDVIKNAIKRIFCFARNPNENLLKVDLKKRIMRMKTGKARRAK